jgi:hypothetical protein
MKHFKDNWAVAAFFIFFFLVLQFFNDWQYWEYIDNGNPWNTIRYRLLTIPLIMVPYYLYYKWQVPLLVKKKFFLFVISLIGFLLFLEFYGVIIDWITSIVVPNHHKAPFRWNNYHFPNQSFHLTFLNLAGITGFAFFQLRWKGEKLISQMREQQLQSELHSLKAQLHPHFFFNTLNNIYSLALERSAKTAPVVENLSKLMRYVVYETDMGKVPLTNEVKFMEDYVALEQIRHDNAMAINFSVQGNPAGIQVPPLLFMPLLENCFKHGFSSAEPFAEVTMLIENGEIIVATRNRFVKNAGVSQTGIGLDNLSKRLQLLYAHRHRLLITENEDIFEVTLILDPK